MKATTRFTMSIPTFNTKSPTIRRILKEAAELSTNPDPSLHAAPLESDLFEWHFTLSGPPSTPYSSGIYHGRIILPPSYPLRPPSFRFLTPSGRFEVNREICLSISGHHEETWQPAWGIRTALAALRAFMEGGAKGQVGGMEMGEEGRRKLAGESRQWRCEGCGRRSNEEILQEEEGRCKGKGKEGEEERTTVPEGLRLGYRDEMDAEKDTAPPAERTSQQPTPSVISQRNSSTRKVPASNISTSSRTPFAPSSRASISNPSFPSSSSSSSSALRSQTLTHQQQQQQQRPSDPVPAWIDKAIAGLIAGLAFMVIHKLML